jgi:aminobenzoyl-glutamate utilization protein B
MTEHRLPLALLLAVVPTLGQSPQHQQVIALVSANAPAYQRVSKQIWDYAELGYHEQKSATLLESELKSAGFSIETPLPDMPTAFVASFGAGKPVIGILGEFDALPGLSQQTSPDRNPVVAGAPGHGCGHNLLGSAAALAAVSVKQYMEKNHIAGTLRFYGTPAEEGGSGKVYMLRAGLFKDVDVVLHWHPADRNSVFNGGTLADSSAKFTFHGVAAHAAFAPDRGRSALDAVMLMGNAVEFMREHVPSNTRLHYIITKGGVAPNVVPDLAQLFLTARSPSTDVLGGIWERIQKCAQGAALMTETSFDLKVVSSDANVLPNQPLAELAQKELLEVGGFTYTPEQKQFALDLQKSLPTVVPGHFDSSSAIVPLQPADPNAPAASTDVGDISWFVPTIGFTAATFVSGCPPHTWQAAATAGMSIGQEAMLIAAKSLALISADLYAHPETIAAAKADLDSQLKTMTYKTAIPAGQKPPIGYRED